MLICIACASEVRMTAFAFVRPSFLGGGVDPVNYNTPSDEGPRLRERNGEDRVTANPPDSSDSEHHQRC